MLITVWPLSPLLALRRCEREDYCPLILISFCLSPLPFPLPSFPFCYIKSRKWEEYITSFWNVYSLFSCCCCLRHTISLWRCWQFYSRSCFCESCICNWCQPTHESSPGLKLVSLLALQLKRSFGLFGFLRSQNATASWQDFRLRRDQQSRQELK